MRLRSSPPPSPPLLSSFPQTLPPSLPASLRPSFSSSFLFVLLRASRNIDSILLPVPSARATPSPPSAPEPSIRLFARNRFHVFGPLLHLYKRARTTNIGYCVRHHGRFALQVCARVLSSSSAPSSSSSFSSSASLLLTFRRQHRSTGHRRSPIGIEFLAEFHSCESRVIA